MSRFVPQVVNEWDTIKHIIEHNVGISRYGDGEFKLILGRKTKPQLADKELSQRLKQILITPNQKCIVGIPNIYQGVQGSEPKSHNFWVNQSQRKEYYDYISPKIKYYSSFITRPDNTTGINTLEYFNYCKKIWEDKNVVVVMGETLQFSKDESLLDNCNIRGIVRGPLVNAWDNYHNIMNECLKYPKDSVFLLRLGPTATVLAWDLCLNGYQALDFGHIGMFYNRLTQKLKESQMWDYNDRIYSYGEGEPRIVE